MASVVVARTGTTRGTRAAVGSRPTLVSHPGWPGRGPTSLAIRGKFRGVGPLSGRWGEGPAGEVGRPRRSKRENRRGRGSSIPTMRQRSRSDARESRICNPRGRAARWADREPSMLETLAGEVAHLVRGFDCVHPARPDGRLAEGPGGHRGLALGPPGAPDRPVGGSLVMASSNVGYRMIPDWSEMRRLYGRGFLADIETSTRPGLRRTSRSKIGRSSWRPSTRRSGGSGFSNWSTGSGVPTGRSVRPSPRPPPCWTRSARSSSGPVTPPT